MESSSLAELTRERLASLSKEEAQSLDSELDALIARQQAKLRFKKSDGQKTLAAVLATHERQLADFAAQIAQDEALLEAVTRPDAAPEEASKREAVAVRLSFFKAAQQMLQIQAAELKRELAGLEGFDPLTGKGVPEAIDVATTLDFALARAKIELAVLEMLLIGWRRGHRILAGSLGVPMLGTELEVVKEATDTGSLRKTSRDLGAKAKPDAPKTQTSGLSLDEALPAPSPEGTDTEVSASGAAVPIEVEASTPPVLEGSELEISGELTAAYGRDPQLKSLAVEIADQLLEAAGMLRQAKTAMEKMQYADPRAVCASLNHPLWAKLNGKGYQVARTKERLAGTPLDYLFPAQYLPILPGRNEAGNPG